jgi:hypothetical protein
VLTGARSEDLDETDPRSEVLRACSHGHFVAAARGP